MRLLKQLNISDEGRSPFTVSLVLVLSSFVLLGLVLVGCTTPATPAPSASPQPTHPPVSGHSATSPDSSEVPSRTPQSNAVATPQAKPLTPASAPGLPSDRLKDPEDQPPPTSTSPIASTFPPAPDRNLYQLSAQLSLHTDLPQIPRVVNPDPVSYAVGREDTFWLVNFRDMSMYQSEFELKLVTPRAYWYVEKDEPVSLGDLEQAAAQFEENVYPRVSAAFGQEWSPGVDNDPHLNIIHARLQGVAGYFSSSDEHPQSVAPYSNQREGIYINSRSLVLGSNTYLEVLSHELQHAIHWNSDSSEDTWINEGLSELAVTIAGHPSAESPYLSINPFMNSPTVSLIHWPLDNVNVSAHYGGASLFMHYLLEHYSNGADLRQLVAAPGDSVAGINYYLKQSGYSVTFRDVFRDWVVANILDEAQGAYGYRDLEVQTSVTESIDNFTQFQSEIPQYSAEYVQLESFTEPVRLRFQAPVENSLLPVNVGPEGCWWSNSGDSINSTLTRAVDLKEVTRATLNYEVWHNVEENWDYGYIEVSVDGGRTWKILATPHTSPENPIGNSFGPGYTGESHDWINESIDLTPYTGQEVLLRFQYVTDDAVSGAGICLRHTSVPEAGLAEDDMDWQAEGFVLISNRVKQDYIVQVIESGEETRVSALPLDANNNGEMVISSPETSQQLIVAVAALAPKTLQPAPYTLTIEPAN
jgi:immune inhibitor A